MPIRTRVAPLAALLLLTAAPLAAQAPPVETRMISLEGRALRVQTGGWHHRERGRPIVVLQSGVGTPLETWQPILDRIAAFAPVVAYDRPGIGRSEWDERPPTPEHVTAHLRRLLAALGAEAPYVLVGFSWGGSLIQHYAGTHPAEVAGLVFIDAPELTRWPERDRAIFDEAGAGAAGLQAFNALERAQAAGAPPGVRAEFDVLIDVVEGKHPALAALTRPSVPTAVLVAGQGWEFDAAYAALPIDFRRLFEVDRRHTMRQHLEMLAGEPEATLVYATHAGHAIHRDDPHLVVEAIRRVAFPDVARQLARAIAEDGAPAAVELYQRLKRSHPAERFDEELLNQLGYRLLREGKTEAAIAVFQLNVREYPYAPNPHDSLGDGYAAAGRLPEALASYRSAVQLAEASGDARLANFRRNVEQTEARLREGR